MGNPYDKLTHWLNDGGIDMAIKTPDCGECPASDCDDCIKWPYISKVVDTIAQEMYLLGTKLAKQWSKVNLAK